MKRLLIALSGFLAFMLTIALSPVASATPPDDPSQRARASIESLEGELEASHTDVATELDNAIEEYAQARTDETLTSKEKEDAHNIMLSLINLKGDYLTYKSGQATSRNVIDEVALRAAVGAAAAYFTAKDYQLSLDLLGFATINLDTTTTYSSRYNLRIRESAVFADIVAGSANSGSDAFPNEGGAIDQDLYFAIHAFDWSKVGGGLLVVQDVYDFERDGDYSGIVGVAVNSMADAQAAGILVPYNYFAMLQMA